MPLILRRFFSRITHTHTFNGPFSRTGKTNLDFTEARDSEWQWHQLGHMQVCTSHQTDNHASTSPLSFFTGRVPFLPPNQQCQSTEGRIFSRISGGRMQRGSWLTIFIYKNVMLCVFQEDADVCCQGFSGIYNLVISVTVTSDETLCHNHRSDY